MAKATWTRSDLDSALWRFERELRDAGFAEPAVRTYVGRSESFVRWLEGDWQPTLGAHAGAEARERPARHRRAMKVVGYAAVAMFALMYVALPFLVLLIVIILA